jgi:hypothetical protein
MAPNITVTFQHINRYMKKIIACGFSWTYGAELNMLTDELKFDRPVSEKFTDYATILGNKYLNAETINLARPGASNYSIAVQIEYALSLKPDLIIFNVTTPERIDVLERNKKLTSKVRIQNFDYSLFPNEHIGETTNEIDSGPNLRTYMRAQAGEKKFKGVSDFLSDYHSYWIKEDQDRLMVLGTFSILEKSKVPYVCVNFSPLFQNNELDNTITVSWQKMCESYPLVKDPYHFSVEGHEYLADRISEFITTNKILSL